MQFKDLDLIEPLLAAIVEEGYENPTPIQQQAIPPVLQGLDVFGCAQTGTGKTAAFALPILQQLALRTVASGSRPIRALVLTPTRELAAQVGESFDHYGARTRIRSITIFGGVSQVPQVQGLRRSPDVLVATPGRLMDLMNQGFVKLDHLEILVLDEADRMLDMGFINDIRRILKAVPDQRQTLLFSATMPPDIMELANTILKDPVSIAVTPPASTVDKVQQGVCFVEKPDKDDLLIYTLSAPQLTRVLVFTRTKHGADKVVRKLGRTGISGYAIHGNKSQGARTKALEAFKSGEVRVLVATDIAARGIDVEGITHVINFDLPWEPDVYVHRIGRTARAGESGVAISFCATEERPLLRGIELLIQQHLHRIEDHPYKSTQPLPPMTRLEPEQRYAKGPRPPARPQAPRRAAAPRPQGERAPTPRRQQPNPRPGTEQPAAAPAPTSDRGNRENRDRDERPARDRAEGNNNRPASPAPRSGERGGGRPGRPGRGHRNRNRKHTPPDVET